MATSLVRTNWSPPIDNSAAESLARAGQPVATSSATIKARIRNDGRGEGPFDKLVSMRRRSICWFHPMRVNRSADKDRPTRTSRPRLDRTLRARALRRLPAGSRREKHPEPATAR